MSSETERLPPPNQPAAFESLCLDLWKAIWADPGAQKNGRSGQPQGGVDIYGQSQSKWMGVQCKQKDELLWRSLKPKELQDEVTKARTFRPLLSSFVVATSGPASAVVQEKARALTEKHQTTGLFCVEVWSWEKIWHELYGRSDLLRRLLPAYWPSVTYVSESVFGQKLGAVNTVSYVPIRVGDSTSRINLMMRWGVYRSSAIVLVRTTRSSRSVVESLSELEGTLQHAAEASNKTIPERLWFSATEAIMVKREGPAKHLDSLSISAESSARLESGNERLGLVVSGLKDFTPATVARLNAWVTSLTQASPNWQPLVIMLHELGRASAHNAASMMQDIVLESVEVLPEFDSDFSTIRPDRGRAMLNANCIGKLLALAWRDGQPSDAETQFVSPVTDWLSAQGLSVTEKVATPFLVGQVVAELEAQVACTLAGSLCDWLLAYHPSFTIAFVKALAASEMEGLRNVAVSHCHQHPQLMDAWVSAIMTNQRRSSATAALRATPQAAWALAAAWCRGLLRGDLGDDQELLDWMRQSCPTLLPLSRAVVGTAGSSQIISHLENGSPSANFRWLALVVSCLDLPFEDAEASTRMRPEYWELVQAMDASPEQLRRVLALSAEDRSMLGCCTDAEIASLVTSPAWIAQIKMLRHTSVAR